MSIDHHGNMGKVLERRTPSRMPYADSLWPETKERYVREGHMEEDEDPIGHFDMSLRRAGWINSSVDLDHVDEILEDDEDARLVKNGNFATLRWNKKQTGTPEHIAFDVTDRAGWERLARPRLVEFDRRRFNAEAYAAARERARGRGEYFMWEGVGPFEQFHPLCGHENLLLGMALEPEWIADMTGVYVDLTLRHLEALFAEAGEPDGLFFYEDMGFKDHPFMSPAMYAELVQPGHARLFDWAHRRGLKVIVHSCGFVEPLVPGLVEAGMDCLQAMEVKAGMDLPRLFRLYGDRIAFMGGFDVRALISNDPALVDGEFERAVLPVIAAGGAYILHSDHSIPPEVDYETLRRFFDLSRRAADVAR